MREIEKKQMHREEGREGEGGKDNDEKRREELIRKK